MISSQAGTPLTLGQDSGWIIVAFMPRLRLSNCERTAETTCPIMTGSFSHGQAEALKTELVRLINPAISSEERSNESASEGDTPSAWISLKTSPALMIPPRGVLKS